MSNLKIMKTVTIVTVFFQKFKYNEDRLKIEKSKYLWTGVFI